MLSDRMGVGGKRTALPAAYFFSVVMAAPARLAALRADEPRTTVSRAEAPLRALLPILTSAVSQADILTVLMWLL